MFINNIEKELVARGFLNRMGMMAPWTLPPAILTLLTIMQEAKVFNSDEETYYDKVQVTLIAVFYQLLINLSSLIMLGYVGQKASKLSYLMVTIVATIGITR